MAFLLGIIVLIVCAIITTERKNLIPDEDKVSAKAIPEKTKKLSTKAQATAETTKSAEFKNSVGLNILLYVGCFLIIAAIMGYVSTVEKELIPPIVLTVTIMAFVASILIFKYVKFLKPSSYAFNITSLIMFLFWIPSLEALGLEIGYAALASFFFLTGAGIISASIFKSKALWYAPAASVIGLIISGLTVIDTDADLNGNLVPYSSILAFMILGIAFRFFWKAKVTWLPVQTRHATRSFSFIYPVFAGFFTLFCIQMIDRYPFALSLFTILFSFYLMLSPILLKKKSLISILRISLEAICIALAIDFSYGIATSADAGFQRNIVLLTVLICSFIQGLISIIMLAIKHDEISHARERFMFTISIFGLSICAFIGGLAMQDSLRIGSGDSLNTIITLSAQLVTIVFSALALFFDRNALMLILVGFSLSDIALTNLQDSPVAACIVLSIGAVLFSVSYSAIRKLDEKHALPASIITASICTLFGLALGQEASIAYIPILGVGISMAAQGFLLKNSGLRIGGVYVTALGIVSAWASIRSEFAQINPSISYYGYGREQYPVGVFIVDAIMCLVPPAAAFFLSIFDKKETMTLKDGSETTRITPNFVVGAILTISNAVYILPSIGTDIEFFCFTLALAMLIILLIWSAAKKWLAFEIASLVAILVLVFRSVGDNIWLTLIIAGMCIIGIVIFISYKNYKKFNNSQSTAIAPKSEEKKAKPAEEAPKTEDKEKPAEEASESENKVQPVEENQKSEDDKD